MSKKRKLTQFEKFLLRTRETQLRYAKLSLIKKCPINFSQAFWMGITNERFCIQSS